MSYDGGKINMSCKSALYAVNSSEQTLAVGDIVSFGSIVRRFGCNCSLYGGNAVISGSGYYGIDANVTVVPQASGVLTLSMFKDGVQIPGAISSISVVANSTYAITIPSIVRQMCNCESTLTLVVSGETTNVTNAAISVKKI